MAKKPIKDLDDGRIFHLINQERKVDKIILRLSAVYVVFLIWAVMFDFGVFAKTVVVTFVILFTYFMICKIMDIYDWYQDRK
ncbi:hypothetical protein [Lactobacillus xylocopicola]|uniref:Uncharacterized protein n=1 Tax=Lactobacillus xylocopicola TaxID=2976676 RepID=A0ABN6SKU3_9LACO|nr:hypothetical protein [Lactobacillus xylocopicola]BDR60998.1 hypothetical protein KIM322_12590 [Lactobacillus xylocopicola]